MAPASLSGSVLSRSPLFAPSAGGASAEGADETVVLASDPLSRETDREADAVTGSASTATPDETAGSGSFSSLRLRPPFAPSVGITPGPEGGRVPWGLVSTALLAVVGLAGAVPAGLQARRRLRTRNRGEAGPVPPSVHGEDPEGPRPGPAVPIPVTPILIAPPDGAPSNGAPLNGAPVEPVAPQPPAPARPAVPEPEPEPAEQAPPRRATLADPVGVVAVVAVGTVHVNGRGNGSASAAPAAPAVEPVRPVTALPLAEQMRSLRLEARLATVSLTLLPVLVATVRAVSDPTFVPRLLTSVVGLLVLVVATGLSVVGAWWLSGLHAAPFPAVPWRRRERAGEWEAEAQLAGVLETAAGLAGAGRSLDDAITDAAARERAPAATALHAGLASRSPGLTAGSESASGSSELVALCARALRADVERGVPAQMALASSAARLRLALQERIARRHARLPVTALLPFAACLLPATVLLAVVGW